MLRRTATSALSLLLATALALAPTRGAFAADDTSITVWTKDGGIYRGEIVERVPNDHVTIKLATGETKRIAWKDYDRDSTTALPTPAPTPTPVVPAAPSPPAAGADPLAPGAAHVHLEGPEHARLERYLGSASLTTTYGSGRSSTYSSASVTISSTECYAPCDRSIGEGRYFVAAEGKRDSLVFDLPSGKHRIEAKLGNPYVFWGGVPVIIIGTGLLLVGAVFILQTPVDTFEPNSSAYHRDNGPRYRGIAISLGGALVVAGGIAMMVKNTNSVRLDGKSVARAKARCAGFGLTPNGFVF